MTEAIRNIQVIIYKIDPPISALTNINKARHLYDAKLIKTVLMDSYQLVLPSVLHSIANSALSPCVRGQVWAIAGRHNTELCVC